MIYKYLYIIVLLISFSTFGQKDTLQYEKNHIEIKQFNKEKLSNFKNQKDFQYDVEKEVRNKTWLDHVLKWIGNRLKELLQWLFGDRRAVGVFKFIVTVLPYVVGILMLLLILKVFINVRTEGIYLKAGINTHIKMSDEEKIIKNRDIKALITKALKEKDYRLAIRYHYLYILQQFEVKGLINWELQKTNHDYEKELLNKQLKQHFKDITYLYDFVWYGDFKIEKKDFEKAEVQFKNIERIVDE